MLQHGIDLHNRTVVIATVDDHGALVSAFTIFLETDGMERFPSPRHFFSYCRVVPGAANSGGKTRNQRSKEGNRYLKAKVLADAAPTHLSGSSFRS